MSNKSAVIIVVTLIGTTFGGLMLWLLSKDGNIYQTTPVLPAVLTETVPEVTQNQREPDKDKPIRVPKYRVLEDKLEMDNIACAQISLVVAITDEITRQNLKVLIDHLDTEISLRGPFRYFEHPSVIWLRILARNDTVLIANAYKRPMDDSLVFQIKQELIETINDPPVEKYGLTELQRQAIWHEIILVNERAQKEAKTKYTVPYQSTSTDSNEAITPDRNKSQNDLKEQLSKKYMLDLAASRGLSIRDFNSIMEEGQQKSWLTIDFGLYLESVKAKLAAEGFRGIPWGSNEATIKEKESAEFEIKEGSWLVYKGTVAGLQAKICYRIIDGVLCQARYLFLENHTNTNEYITDYNNLLAILERKYGKAPFKEIDWKNKTYANDESRFGLAVSMGHLTYSNSWLMAEGKLLELFMVGDNYKITTIMDYKGFDYLDTIKLADQIDTSEGF